MPNPTRTHGEVTKGWHPDEQRWLEQFRETLAADYAEAVKKALLLRVEGPRGFDSRERHRRDGNRQGRGSRRTGEDRGDGRRARVLGRVLEGSPVRADEDGV